MNTLFIRKANSKTTEVGLYTHTAKPGKYCLKYHKSNQAIRAVQVRKFQSDDTDGINAYADELRKQIINQQKGNKNV